MVEPGAKQLLELHFNAGETLRAETTLSHCSDLSVCISEPLTSRLELTLPLCVSLRSIFSRCASFSPSLGP